METLRRNAQNIKMLYLQSSINVKLSTMITIADMTNLFKKGPCRISRLDFRIFTDDVR